MCAPSPSIGMNQSNRGSGLSSMTGTLSNLQVAGQQHASLRRRKWYFRSTIDDSKRARLRLRDGRRHALSVSPRVRRPPLLFRVARARLRLFASVAVGAVVSPAAAFLTDWRLATRLLIGWGI